jgi:hypothetical protein
MARPQQAQRRGQLRCLHCRDHQHRLCHFADYLAKVATKWIPQLQKIQALDGDPNYACPVMDVWELEGGQLPPVELSQVPSMQVSRRAFRQHCFWSYPPPAKGARKSDSCSVDFLYSSEHRAPDCPWELEAAA